MEVARGQRKTSARTRRERETTRIRTFWVGTSRDVAVSVLADLAQTFPPRAVVDAENAGCDIVVVVVARMGGPVDADALAAVPRMNPETETAREDSSKVPIRIILVRADAVGNQEVG